MHFNFHRIKQEAELRRLFYQIKKKKRKKKKKKKGKKGRGLATATTKPKMPVNKKCVKPQKMWGKLAETALTKVQEKSKRIAPKSRKKH